MKRTLKIEISLQDLVFYLKQVGKLEEKDQITGARVSLKNNIVALMITGEEALLPRLPEPIDVILNENLQDFLIRHRNKGLQGTPTVNCLVQGITELLSETRPFKSLDLAKKELMVKDMLLFTQNKLSSKRNVTGWALHRIADILKEKGIPDTYPFMRY